MNPRIVMKGLDACETFLKDPNLEAPDILRDLKVQDIRLLLQATAESIISSNNPKGLRTLKEMYTLINNRYPLNEKDESPTRSNETFRKREAEEWEQILDNRRKNR